MVQRYEQTRKLQWYKRGAAYYERTPFIENGSVIIDDQLQASMMTGLRNKVKGG